MHTFQFIDCYIHWHLSKKYNIANPRRDLSELQTDTMEWYLKALFCRPIPLSGYAEDKKIKF